MRILQISSASSFGGGERYVVDLSNSLIDRGHEVFVALRPDSPLSPHLNLSKNHIKYFPLRNALDAQSARSLAKLVKDQEIEVVHAHMARDYSLAAYAARNRAKFFVTRHVLFPLNRIHRRTLARANRVIAVSNAVGQQLNLQQIVPALMISVIPNGIDIDRFSRARENFKRERFLSRVGLPVDGLLVGSIGELRTLKRHDDFIRAAEKVSREIDGVQFVIAGVDTSQNGENKKQLVDLAHELKLDDRVHFLGWLDDADQLLCALDVFVSASETESFGLVLAEAMAVGTAVVSTETEGAQEVVDNGVTGVLVPIGEVDAMSRAIVELLKDDDRREQMGQRGVERAMGQFSLKRMVDDIERLYSAS